MDCFVVTRGERLLARYEFTRPAAWPDIGIGIEWVPLVHAIALPGGPVEAVAYDALTGELLDRLAGVGPVDGVLLDLHGALAVLDRIDAEGALAARVRAVVGSEVLVSAAMDLHGNCSRQLVEHVDLLTAHRLAPHEDAWQTRERAARNLVECARDGIVPYRAWVHVPVLLPGERTSTRVDPPRAVYKRVGDTAHSPGIIDAALWTGFAWADEARCRAAVVVTGTNAEATADAAQGIARDYWDRREQFNLVGPSAELVRSVDLALAAEERPFFLSDTGDNITAGGAGDSTQLLAEVLRRGQWQGAGRTVLVAGLLDPAAVQLCKSAGIGAKVSLSLGAHMETRGCAPVAIDAHVRALAPAGSEGGDIAVIGLDGLQIIITSTRAGFTELTHYGRLGVDVASFDVVVVKLGYLFPDLREFAAGWVMALTQGATDLLPERLTYDHVVRPLYPLDRELPEPDLTPLVLAAHSQTFG